MTKLSDIFKFLIFYFDNMTLLVMSCVNKEIYQFLKEKKIWEENVLKNEKQIIYQMLKYLETYMENPWKAYIISLQKNKGKIFFSY